MAGITLRGITTFLWGVASLIWFIYFALGTPWEELIRSFMALMVFAAGRIVLPDDA